MVVIPFKSDVAVIADKFSPAEFTGDDAWKNSLKRNAKGEIQSRSINNVELLITHDTTLKNVIVYDEFSGTIMKQREIPKLNAQIGFWTDADDSALRSYLEKLYGILFSRDMINDAVVNCAHRHTVNPVKDWIEASKWDEKPRAETYFIDYLGAEDTAYTRAITKVWLTGAVARVYEPGCKFEIVPILEGRQGIGKSTAVRNLFPRYFNDSLQGLGRNKDDYEQLKNSWIVEIAELSAMKRTDVDKLKNFISSQSDLYRGAYQKYSIPHPRQNVFVGTTNQTGYLKDATGERRFYPIKCGVIEPKLDPLKTSTDVIHQILAEALHWYKTKQPLYPSKDTLEAAKVIQSEARVADPIREVIEQYLEMKVPTNWDRTTDFYKANYFKNYNAGKDSAEVDEWLDDEKSLDQIELTKDDGLVPLPKVSSAELMNAFGVASDQYASITADKLSKRIRIIMDNYPGWIKKKSYFNGQQLQGYFNDSDP